MEVARVYGAKLATVANLSPKALYELATPLTPPEVQAEAERPDSRDDWNDLLAPILFGVKYSDLQHRKSVLQILRGFQRAVLRFELGLQMTVHHQAISGR
jgi:hypothetical protein